MPNLVLPRYGMLSKKQLFLQAQSYASHNHPMGPTFAYQNSSLQPLSLECLDWLAGKLGLRLSFFFVLVWKLVPPDLSCPLILLVCIPLQG